MKPFRTAWTMLLNPVHLISFGGGLGLAPMAPGTFGTLPGFALAAGLLALGQWAPLWVVALVWLLLLALGTWCADVTARALGEQDPGAIVCDEYVAFAGVLLLVAPHWPTWIWAFLCFRLFDVTKPFPVGWADARLHGGIGIMVDDLLAAVWALGLLYLLALLKLPGGPLW